MTEHKDFAQVEKPHVPLYLSPIPAGFPSPADDYTENVLSLDDLLIQHPRATFYVRVKGDSMLEACIADGDILVVDRSLEASHNAIVVAIVNGEYTVKRLYHKGQYLYLVPANRQYKPIRITEEMQFQVWGVVTYCIRKVR
jgi:DNA polymerase V